MRIPPGVTKVTRADGSTLVELYISTPNGISNKLQIPLPPDPEKADPATFSPFLQSPSALALADSSLTLKVDFTPGTTPTAVLQPVPDATVIRIVPTGPIQDAQTADVKLVFQLGNINLVNEIVIPKVAKDKATGGFTITGTQLNASLIKSLPGQLKQVAIQLSPTTTVVTKRVEVQFPPADGKTFPPIMQTTNNLTIGFAFILKTSALSRGGALDGVATNARSGTSKPLAARTADPTVRQTSTDAAARAGVAELPPLPGEEPADKEVVLTQIPAAPASLSSSVVSAFRNPADPGPVLPPSGINIPITGGSIQIPGTGAGNVQLPGTGGTFHLPGNVKIQIPGTNRTVDVAGTVALPLSGTTPSTTQAPIVLPPAQSINVSVPVTNVARQPRQGVISSRQSPRFTAEPDKASAHGATPESSLRARARNPVTQVVSPIFLATYGW